MWTYVLEDGAGVDLCELVTASGRTFKRTRNSYMEAGATLDHRSDEASLFFGALTAGVPRLRVYSDDQLRFRGYLAPFQDTIQDGLTTIQLTFRSPFYRLLGDGSQTGRFTDTGVVYGAMDAAAISFAMLNTTNAADGPTGLVPGDAEPTVPRTSTLTYANVGAEIQRLSALLDGFDFYEEPIESGPVLARLQIRAQMGQARPDARFEYGPGTLANVAAITRQWQPPINVVRTVGDSAYTGRSSDPTSIGTFGAWPAQYTQSGVADVSLLNSRAAALQSHGWIRTLNFTPEPTLCPAFGVDIDIGDTAPLYASDGAFREDVSVRLNGYTIAIDDNGNPAPEIDDPTTPYDDDVIRSTATVEVLT